MPFLSVSALSGLRITKHWAGSPLPAQEAQNVGRLGPPCRTGRLTAPAAQLRGLLSASNTHRLTEGHTPFLGRPTTKDWSRQGIMAHPSLSQLGAPLKGHPSSRATWRVGWPRPLLRQHHSSISSPLLSLLSPWVFLRALPLTTFLCPQMGLWWHH